ncbi:MAG: hypothetical protein ABSH05_24140 [Bryobacteraceae bacterium]
MRLSAILAAGSFAALAFGQSSGAPELRRTGEDVTRLRALVQEGALPRQKLEGAQRTLADAQDEATLRTTLYGKLTVEDLTERQGQEMTAAATRMFERRKAQLEQARKLVDEGALPRLALTPYIEELDRSRRALDLAVSRAALLTELAEMARREKEALARSERTALGPAPLAERYDGDGLLRAGDLKTITLAFEKQFSRPLPVSAVGDTAVHRALGFDHRGRIDVALDPDQPEGIWLRQYLQTMRIPYFAFRSFLSGRATGPHIHVGPPSERISRGG